MLSTIMKVASMIDDSKTILSTTKHLTPLLYSSLMYLLPLLRLLFSEKNNVFSGLMRRRLSKSNSLIIVDLLPFPAIFPSTIDAIFSRV